MLCKEMNAVCSDNYRKYMNRVFYRMQNINFFNCVI